MNIIRDNLLKEPALIVGLVRAALILAVSFGVAFSQAQMDSTVAFVGALLAVISLALTGVTRSIVVSPATSSERETDAFNVGLTAGGRVG